MTQTELEKTHELVDFIHYDVLRFNTDTDTNTDRIGSSLCAGCPLRAIRGKTTSSCARSGCGPRTVWVPKEHAATSKIAYRKEP